VANHAVRFEGIVESRGADRAEVEGIVARLNVAFPGAFSVEFDGGTFSIFASDKTISGVPVDDAALHAANLLRPLVQLVPIDRPIESTLRCTETTDQSVRQSVFIFAADVEVVSRTGAADASAVFPQPRKTWKAPGLAVIVGVMTIAIFVGYVAVTQYLAYHRAQVFLSTAPHDLAALEHTFAISLRPQGESVYVVVTYRYPDAVNVDGSDKDAILSHALSNGDFSIDVEYANGKTISHGIAYDAYKEGPVIIQLQNYNRIGRISVRCTKISDPARPR
jgi:hypothetical protein